MQFTLAPYSGEIENYLWWDDAFNDRELDWLQQQAASASQTALVGGAECKTGGINNNMRRSSVAWLNCTPGTEWIFARLGDVVSTLNAKHYKFDITGFGEALQLTNYDESVQGMYGWHQDYGGKISRKLSAVLQLSHPHEYEGGELQILTGDVPISIPKKRGRIALFPSYVVHQVTPVTKGNRQSLVAWVSGPSFR